MDTSPPLGPLAREPRDLEPVATRAVACLSLPAASHTHPFDDEFLPASLCCFGFYPLRSLSDSAHSSDYTRWHRGRHSIDGTKAMRCFKRSVLARSCLARYTRPRTSLAASQQLMGTFQSLRQAMLADQSGREPERAYEGTQRRLSSLLRALRTTQCRGAAT